MDSFADLDEVVGAVGKRGFGGVDFVGYEVVEAGEFRGEGVGFGVFEAEKEDLDDGGEVGGKSISRGFD